MQPSYALSALIGRFQAYVLSWFHLIKSYAFNCGFHFTVKRLVLLAPSKSSTSSAGACQHTWWSLLMFPAFYKCASSIQSREELRRRAKILDWVIKIRNWKFSWIKSNRVDIKYANLHEIIFKSFHKTFRAKQSRLTDILKIKRLRYFLFW